MSKTVLFQIIQFRISTQFFLFTKLNGKAVSSIWSFDRTLSDTTTPGGPGNDDSEGAICIPQSSSITGA